MADEPSAPKAPVWKGRARALLFALAAAAVPFLVMCTLRHFRFSVPLGFVCCVASSLGFMSAVGTFEGSHEGVAARSTITSLRPELLTLLASIVAHIGVLTLAVAGVFPQPIITAAILVPATFLWVVVALYRVARKAGAYRDPNEPDRPLLHRHGFWLVVIHALVYLPLLGSYSLSDPWETHYGEVAREMLARDDWISTWWAQDGWFWSKPVLDFWIQALSFSLLGVKYMPDQMLASVAQGRFPQPEWAARMPVFLLTLAGAYVLYRAVATILGRRAGFFAGLALTTMPYWYLVAHQTMTDMPYVGPLVAAMGFVLLGFLTDPDREVKTFELTVGKRVFRISALHVVLLAVTVSALPQILYLVSRNLTLYLERGYTGFKFHPDEFMFGSGGGDCGVPGNEPCRKDTPVFRQLWPIMAAGIWAVALGLFLWVKRHERRLSQVYFLAGWYFLSLSMLGKGAPGLVLPIVITAGFAVVTGRFRALERVEILSLVLVIACVGLPWYVQMYVRHGPPFIDRLIMHDMYKRAFVHVHDTNQGDDTSFRYYVWQLGYGLFPWTGLAAGGLLWGFRRPDRTRDREGDVAAFMMVWFVAAFGMFTITLTKFHHYILPLVPATAVLTGLVANRLVGDGSPAQDGKLPQYLVGLLAGSTLTLLGITRLFPRTFSGLALAAPRSPVLGVVLGLVGVAVTWWCIRKYGRSAGPPATGVRTDEAAYALVGLSSAAALALAGRDMFTKINNSDGSARLMHRLTYNYTRPWPESFDFSGAFAAFTAVCGVLSLGLCLPSVRRHMAALFCATAVLWSAWGLDVYLFKCAPHWGQRETVMAYYTDRKSPDSPFVAYQMNWKGENFYTGNKTPAFVSTGDKFKNWIVEQQKRGIKEMYFTSEHGRSGSLKREIGDTTSYREITDKTLNNKFFTSKATF